MKTLASNKKAYFNYDIKSHLTAGMVLSGGETKSVKEGSASLTGAYVVIRGEEAYLTHAHIPPYKYAGGKEPQNSADRDRKLLLKKKEIASMIGKEKGLVIMPLEIFQGHRGLLKLKIGLGFGKKKHDKRESIKKRDINKRIRRAED